MLSIVRDSSGIDHDTLIAPCSASMYRFVGAADDHRSCAANYHAAFPERADADPPQPWNLFMIAAVASSGAIKYARPPLLPGMAVELRAEMDLVVVVSACPDDHYPTNGGDGSPKAVMVEVHSTAD